MNKREIFKLLTTNFEIEGMKQYYLDMCEEIPDYIFTMPSSTSGKYHNQTQCQEHGQLYHIFMFHSILEHLLRLKHNKERFSTPEERDAMRCVPAFHDAVKCGWNGSQYTVQDHPKLAAKWVLDTKVVHDIPLPIKQMIADMCESHSGQWNKNRSGEVIMSEPRNEREFLIHECDILASRPDLDWIISDDLKKAIAGNFEEPKIDDYLIPMGKYKDRYLVEIFALDRDYCEWMLENITRQPLLSYLKELFHIET